MDPFAGFVACFVETIFFLPFFRENPVSNYSLFCSDTAAR
jgi:hypothetical protein